MIVVQDNEFFPVTSPLSSGTAIKFMPEFLCAEKISSALHKFPRILYLLY